MTIPYLALAFLACSCIPLAQALCFLHKCNFPIKIYIIAVCSAVIGFITICCCGCWCFFCYHRKRTRESNLTHIRNAQAIAPQDDNPNPPNPTYPQQPSYIPMAYSGLPQSNGPVQNPLPAMSIPSQSAPSPQALPPSTISPSPPPKVSPTGAPKTPPPLYAVV